MTAWLTSVVGEHLAGKVLDSFASKDFARRLVAASRAYDGVSLTFVERSLLRQLLRMDSTWPLLVNSQGDSSTALAGLLSSEVLHARRSGPSVEDRAQRFAAVLIIETPGALDVEDVQVLFGQRLEQLRADVDLVKKALAPRPHMPAIDAFLSLEDYYLPFLQPDTRFHHRSALVGRETESASLANWLHSEDGPLLLLVTATAGAGKSRLVLEGLAEFEEEAPSVTVVVLADGSRVTDDQLARLPEGELLVLIEDAHSDLIGTRTVLSFAKRRGAARVVTTSRWTEAVEAAAVQAHLDTTDVQLLGVDRLPIDAARQLVAANATGLRLTPGGAETLAIAARETPVIAVLALSMIRRGELDGPLTTDATIRREVMLRYGQVVTTGIGNIPPASARRLLAAVTAVGSVSLDSKPDIDFLAAFLRTDRVTLLGYIDALLEAGPLVERNRELHVVPEVLADEILSLESVRAWSDTGFIGELWGAFAGRGRMRLLVAIGELDWRVRRVAAEQSEVRAPDLFSGPWREVAAKALEGTNAERCDYLRQLGSLPATQAPHVLAFIERLQAQPASAEVDEAHWRTRTGIDVGRACSQLLDTVAESDHDLLPRTLDALWRFAKEDHGKTNPHPDHPARVLEDLANLGDRPVSWPFAIVDAVERWLTEPDPVDAPRTPLDVLRPLVAKSGYTQDYGPADDAITFTPFALTPDNLSPLRDRLRAVLVAAATAGPPRRTLASASVLCEALHEPIGYFGIEIEDVVSIAWEDDDLKTLAALVEVAGSTCEPLVRIEMRDSVDAIANDHPSDGVRQRAEELATGLDDHLDDLLTALLVFPYPRHVTARGARAALASEDVDGSDEPPGPLSEFDIARAKRQITVEVSYVVRGLRALDVDVALDTISSRVSDLTQLRTDARLVGIDHVLGSYCRTLLVPELDAAVDLVAHRFSAELGRHAYVPLTEMADRDTDRFQSLLVELIVEGPAQEVLLGVLHGFAYMGWIDRVPDSSVALAELMAHEDADIAAGALGSAGDLLKQDVTQWQPQLLSIVGTHPLHVEQALNHAARPHADAWVRTLDEEDQELVLALISALPRWNFETQRVIAALAFKLPKAVVDLLADRHHLPVEVRFHGIRGLPEALSRSPEAIVDWMVSRAAGTDVEQFNDAELSGTLWGYPMTAGAMRACSDLIERGVAAEVVFLSTCAARYEAFAVEQPELTAAMIQSAAQMPPESRDECLGGLRASLGTVRPLRRSEPDAGREHRRALCLELAARPGIESALQDFYLQVAEQLSPEMPSAGAEEE